MLTLARDAALIALTEARRTLTSVRALVLLVLFILFSGLVAAASSAASHAAAQATSDSVRAMQGPGGQLDDQLKVGRRAFLGLWFSSDAELLDAVEDVPVFLLVLFKLSLVFLPGYVALLGFDSVSAELASRSLRYVAVRTRRSAVLLGKFAGLGLVLAALVACTWTLFLGWAAASTPGFGALAAGAAWARFSVSSVVYALSWLALTLLCSTLVRVPMVGLVLNGVAMFSLWLVDVLGGMAASPLAPLRFVAPTHYAEGLLHPALDHFGVAVLACAAFAAAMLGTAHLSLRARDL